MKHNLILNVCKTSGFDMKSALTQFMAK